LPLRLQPLHLARGGVPVDRVLDRLRLDDERFLLREVLGPDGLALGEVGVATGEEAIAGAAEALPDRLLLAAADRADRLPLGLQLLDLVGGLNPVGGVGERLGALTQGDLPGEVLAARLGLRREMRLAPRPRFVVRRLEPFP